MIDLKATMGAWKRFGLHDDLLKGLYTLNFFHPTKIQEKAIPKALEHHDILGAAETGSGKTLAFGLPVLHRILEQFPPDSPPSELPALIIAPTRELATQVADMLIQVSRYTHLKIIKVIGGMSAQKQERLVGKNPHVIVGTPGRLWELTAQGLLKDLSTVRYVVIDEADRMVETGHFAELRNLFSVIKNEEPVTEEIPELVEEVDGEEMEHSEQTTEPNPELESTESKTIEPDRIVTSEPESDSKLDTEPQSTKPESESKLDTEPQSAKPESEKSDVAESGEGSGESEKKAENSEGGEVLESSSKRRRKRRRKAKKQTNKPENGDSPRQVFVFSATLTVSLKAREQVNRKAKTAKRHRVIPKVVAMTGMKPDRVIVDLTTDKVVGDKVRESVVHCIDTDKDYYLYYIHAMFPGRILVFVNSIDCIRRLVALFKILKVPLYPLHANMQQRQRLKNLERFKSKESCMLIATDVAARGLDIPLIDHVVHYQLPRTTELYVHRSGRTARASETGVSVLLVGPKDKRSYHKICNVLRDGEAVDSFEIDSAYMSTIAKRTNIARKIDKMEHSQHKSTSKKNWFKINADALDIDLDDDLVSSSDEEEVGKEMKEQNKLNNLKKELQALLLEPLVPKGVSGKYITHT
eukprot:CAMPEP_0174255554 /NCGR_PEP_ID=MMETSP0439-20130205/4871_1 /TAXON_ID=0 /ORGANISM="Stereomyxa ramosa, Strain Chinc5" /LENGTH=638 /DNA_ID=CAMNT_0015337781 /DNA_START=294 /DNA_END=2206 /DNA_ORIENTATION=+